MTKTFNLVVLVVGMLLVPVTSQAMVFGITAIPTAVAYKAFAQKAQAQKVEESQSKKAADAKNVDIDKEVLLIRLHVLGSSAEVYYAERRMRAQEAREAELIAGRFGREIVFEEQEEKKRDEDNREEDNAGFLAELLNGMKRAGR